MVCQYWDKDGGWKWEELKDLLPPKALGRLATIQISGEGDGREELYWDPTSTRVFALHSAYDLALGEQLSSHMDI